MVTSLFVKRCVWRGRCARLECRLFIADCLQVYCRLFAEHLRIICYLAVTRHFPIHILALSAIFTRISAFKKISWRTEGPSYKDAWTHLKTRVWLRWRRLSIQQNIRDTLSTAVPNQTLIDSLSNTLPLKSVISTPLYSSKQGHKSCRLAGPTGPG